MPAVAPSPAAAVSFDVLRNAFLSGPHASSPTMSLLLAALGWTLAVVGTVTAAPQAVRLWRHRDAEGVSGATAVAGAATMACWIVWTWSIRDLPALGSSIGAFIAWLSITFGYARLVTLRAQCVLALQLTAAVIIVSAAVATAATAVAGVVGSTFWAFPQLRKALTSSSLSGVSVAAYVALSAEDLGWIVYAAGTGVWAYAIAPVLQLPATTLIAWKAWKRRPATGDRRGQRPDAVVTCMRALR